MSTPNDQTATQPPFGGASGSASLRDVRNLEPCADGVPRRTRRGCAARCRLRRMGPDPSARLLGEALRSVAEPPFCDFSR